MRDSIHAYRWFALTIWIVVFTLLTAYAFYVQGEDRHSTERRFCDVTSAFLTSEIQLRDQLNKSDLETIGRRQTVQEAARNAIYVFTLAPSSAVLQSPLRQAIIGFLQSIDDLNVAQVRLGQEALSKTDAFITRLTQLKERLRC